MATQFNVRLDPVTVELVKQLRELLAVSNTDVIKLAVRVLARNELGGKKPEKKSAQPLDNR